MARVLVIDDDHSLARRVSAALRWRGHVVVETDQPDRARSITRDEREHPDLVLLGVALSRSTRPPLLPTLRREGFTGPILVWHDSRDERDIALCFRSGADQYITLPLGMRELLARVDASLTRSPIRNGGNGSANGGRAANGGSMYAFGGIEVDVAAREVYRHGESVSLSPLEFDLLAALLRRDGAATARTDLLREVWKYGPGVMSRTLDTHILNLRTKLEDEPRAPRHIVTVRKVGYRLDR
ncbi:MAG TPA: response regulator transcription factor [Gemmatimonadaceae bacterium]|nr:response regulator transcription factor [Gemmatimonadaceae bacterium]